MHSISASPSTSSELLRSRRLLLHTSVYPSSAPAPTSSGSSSPSPLTAPYMGDESSFDGNLVMILSVLLCALICIFGLIITMIRCPVRGRAAASNDDAAARLANTGVKRKALKTFPTVIYNSPTSLELPGLGTECSICLSEFRVGERLRILPKCNHGFHIKCIGKWLASHSSCPTCRHCLLDTCHKIVASTQPSSSNTPSSPLQPQDVEHCYPGLPRWLAR